MSLVRGVCYTSPLTALQMLGFCPPVLTWCSYRGYEIHHKTLAKSSQVLTLWCFFPEWGFGGQKKTAVDEKVHVPASSKWSFDNPKWRSRFTPEKVTNKIPKRVTGKNLVILDLLKVYFLWIGSHLIHRHEARPTIKGRICFHGNLRVPPLCHPPKK